MKIFHCPNNDELHCTVCAWSSACPSVFIVLHCNPEAKQIHLHANYNSNLPAQAFQQLPTIAFWCHTLSVTTTKTHPSILTDLFDWDAIYPHKTLPFFGKIIPHLTASGQKHEALNHLLHNYCFDVGTLRTKGKHLRATAETPRGVSKNHTSVNYNAMIYWREKCGRQQQKQLKRWYLNKDIIHWFIYLMRGKKTRRNAASHSLSPRRGSSEVHSQWTLSSL